MYRAAAVQRPHSFGLRSPTGVDEGENPEPPFRPALPLKLGEPLREPPTPTALAALARSSSCRLISPRSSDGGGKSRGPSLSETVASCCIRSNECGASRRSSQSPAPSLSKSCSQRERAVGASCDAGGTATGGPRPFFTARRDAGVGGVVWAAADGDGTTRDASLPGTPR